MSEFGQLADVRSTLITTTCWLVTLAAVVVALAGPRVASAGGNLESNGISIMLVADVSGSMAESDFDWNDEKISRLEAVKRSFHQFIMRRPRDRIGLILFATDPDVACPITTDHFALESILLKAQPRGVPTESETNIGDALAWSIVHLQNEPGRKLILICSDGEHNVAPPALLPLQATRLAAAYDINIHAMFAGPHDGPGKTALQAIAELGGGASIDGRDMAQMNAALDRIDEFERDRALDPRHAKYLELRSHVTIVAALLFLATLVYTGGPGRVMPC